SRGRQRLVKWSATARGHGWRGDLRASKAPAHAPLFVGGQQLPHGLEVGRRLLERRQNRLLLLACQGHDLSAKQEGVIELVPESSVEDRSEAPDQSVVDGDSAQEHSADSCVTADSRYCRSTSTPNNVPVGHWMISMTAAASAIPMATPHRSRA